VGSARRHRQSARAGGKIGAAIVAKSPGDGYTLLVHSAAHAYNPAIYSNLTYDTVKDFVEVVPLAGQPNVLVVAPSAIKTVADSSAAKQKPGALNFARGQRQRNAHQRRNSSRRRHRCVHILQGTPEALTDTMAGRVTTFSRRFRRCRRCAKASSPRWE
jgi:tripartite-type tricarboxylate transporter receptor subunit TctC